MDFSSHNRIIDYYEVQESSEPQTELQDFLEESSRIYNAAVTKLQVHFHAAAGAIIEEADGRIDAYMNQPNHVDQYEAEHHYYALAQTKINNAKELEEKGIVQLQEEKVWRDKAIQEYEWMNHPSATPFLNMIRDAQENNRGGDSMNN